MHTPPRVALLLTVAFIVYLFRRDFRERPNVTSALWLPLLWVLLIGSRSPVQWLSLFGYTGGGSIDEGNPLDAWTYFILIVVGFYVLSTRQVSLSEVFRNNAWLMAFLVYCFIAILWSDFPFVAFKRWIKILGHPVMVLVLFTEPNLEEAVERLMKRAAYVLVPMSILFIKYYPEYGRDFDRWTGAGANTGINTNKNELGWGCMILGYFFFCHLLKTLKLEKNKARRNELLLTGSFIYMIWWLLSKSSSATSLMSLAIGILIVVFLGRRFVNKRAIGLYVLLTVTILAAGELTVGLFGHLVDLTGHDETLTGRSNLWQELLSFHTNPVFGVGFESFWLGDRLKRLWAEHWWQPTEAHNGYLETYLNLGLIGLFFLGGLVIATYRKARLELPKNFEFGRFRLGFLAMVIVFNWTEASFKGLSLIWFVFYIISMDYPRPQIAPTEQFSEIADREREMEFAHFRA